MTNGYKHLVAAAAMTFGANLSAQSPAQIPAQPLSNAQIKQQRDAAIKNCAAVKDTARKICEAEADGQKSIAKAQAKLVERDSPKNRLILAETRADADYKIAKLKCDDQVDEAKDVCKNNAKAARNKAKQQARRESQINTQTPRGSGASGDGSDR